MTAPGASPIGPATEARILAAFADRCVIGREPAAQLLGFDVKTLDALADCGAIRVVRRGAGNTRGYTEGDIRAYLTESAAPCRKVKTPRAHQPRIANVVSFTERRRARKR